MFVLLRITSEISLSVGSRRMQVFIYTTVISLCMRTFLFAKARGFVIYFDNLCIISLLSDHRSKQVETIHLTMEDL